MQVIVLVLCLLFMQTAYGQRLAVKSNALSWAVATPDLGLELVTGEKTSLAVSVYGQPFFKDYSFAVLQPEFRYWFNGRPLTQEYIGVTAFSASYDMHFSSRDYAGDGILVGVTGGYVISLAKRWCFELSGGTGLLFFRQMCNEDTSTFELGYKLFPSKLAASFIYIIK